MAKTQDFSEIMKDFMGAFPVDTSSMEDAFKTQAALGEKLSSVAIEAAGKSTDLSTKWTKEALTKIAELSKAKSEPADYAKAMTDFASAYAEMSAENMAAFAEIAKKVQTDTVELMMAAGKDMTEEASAAMQKATKDASTAAKKATPAAK
ncbi:phasin, PhaP [Pseudooceanicola spongiae]|jgi:hypothetical protein|uniref:Phasin, PhaP n=1 Tax=Pseudooceanicola spongiae TaxID=2613965 RepID=A0A7L9WKG8_9RHOB|nr:phasin, PhaP [Pseudooceanicola spongiae]QOL80895.1 phasin, PhaP [Pseudooceanicola spongiae]